MPIATTLKLVDRLRARYNITRIADITHLDRIGIPVMSAIVPDSPDLISFYNGKGTTREAALAGAVMEAVERQIAAAPRIHVVVRDAARTLQRLDRRHTFTEFAGIDIDVVGGYDIMSRAPVDVPLALVQCPWTGPSLSIRVSTDGLASGNTLGEAVYHALAEVIERHLWGIAHEEGYHRPRAIVSRIANATIALPNFVDDPVASDIDVPTGCPIVDDLVDRIVGAGLTVRLRAFEREPFPVLMIAMIVDPAGRQPATHMGMGCSLSPTHAAVRALTEAAQSRAADFAAAREDLYRPDAVNMPDFGIRRASALPDGRWYFDAPSPMTHLRDLRDRATSDIAGDVAALIACLSAAGVGSAAIVDLSPPDVPIFVVKIVAAELDGTGRSPIQSLQPRRS